MILSKLIKNNNFSEANNYINNTNRANNTPLQELLSQIISVWVKVENSKLNYNEAQKIFQSINPKYKNIKKINDTFLNCYFDLINTDEKFLNLINDQTTDFSRYTFFYANYLLKKNLPEKASEILNQKLIVHPKNLLLNQLYTDINQKKQNHLQNYFYCKNISNVIAELFYITANALSVQDILSASNFYISLAKYLNQNFFRIILLCRKFLKIEDYRKAKKTYILLKNLANIIAGIPQTNYIDRH